MRDVAPPWQPPETFDEYRLVAPLGRGQTGLVYVAHDTLLDRHVAIKFIPVLDEALLGRFLVEARAAARIQHPNVATLYRVGQLDHRAYLVWELVRGKSLDRLERPAPAEHVLRLAIDIARGLAAAHRRGVLHRDIKPANVVLADSGEAKLVDFGLAKLIAAPDEITGPGMIPPPAETPVPGEPVVGTPYFRSPEAWRGAELDGRSDLYSVGLLLYELLAGEGPFRHLRVKELSRALQSEDPRPLLSAAPTVPSGLAAVVDRCLRRDREARFASADDLLAALEALSPDRRRGEVPEGNPYRGLRAYDAEHRALFFGRARALQRALERLRSDPLLVLTGDSGVGKSSLCAAGVLPSVAEGALEDGRRWLVGRTVPGRTPLENVAGALARLLGRPSAELEGVLREDPSELGRHVRALLRDELGLLLFIDQMEELVTQGAVADAALTARGLAALTDGLPGVRVLASARSDFLSRLAGLPGLSERLPPSLLLLGPMTPVEIREVITGPAAMKGGRYESEALVETLVASTTSAEGSLPLLQFTLAELWDRRDPDGTITAASLASLGGVSGALEGHADGVLVQMPPEQRQAARAILMRLVTVDGTRARRSEEELVILSPEAKGALEALVRGRLLVAGESPGGSRIYEIAHEALLNGWATLAHWLAEEAELRALRDRLEVAAAEWERLGRPKPLLWSTPQLAELEAKPLSGLTAREREFLEASRVARRVARWWWRGLAAGVVLIGAAVWTGAQIENRREIARAIAADLEQADHAARQAKDALAALTATRAAALASWDALRPEEAEAAWSSAQGLSDRARELHAATAEHLERALLRDPERTDVRERYAELLFDRVRLAEDERRRVEASELTRRLELHDLGGQRVARLRARGTLAITVEPARAALAVHTYDGAVAAIIEPGTSQQLQLDAGAYVLTASAAGHHTTRLPLLVRRAQFQEVRFTLPRAREVPPGFVYLPPGEGLFGSPDAEAVRAWFNAVPLHPIHTGGHLVARHETTFAEWIAFLEALPPAEREARRPRVAGTGFRGMLELSRDSSGRWQIALQPTVFMLRASWGEPVTYPEREHRATQDWRKMPVTGVSFGDAQAYASWLDRTGQVPGARLCTEHEWERAARGTSEQSYPHGDRLSPSEANFDETYGKKPGGFGPDEVGSHPASRSPFGIDDLSGNVWEWTASSVRKGEVVARGGSYYFNVNTARVSNRELPEASFRDLTVGVRLCADSSP